MHLWNYCKLSGIIGLIASLLAFAQAQTPSGADQNSNPAGAPNSPAPMPGVEPGEITHPDPFGMLTDPPNGKPKEPVGNIKIPTSAEAGENWDTLLLPGKPGTRMPASAALDTEPAEYPEFTRELLQLQWRPMDAIDLYVVKPAGVKKPPVILYLYSFPSENDRYINNEFCKALTERGFAAVGFVSNLTGQRYHERPTKQWFVSELQESLATTVHDVQFILDYLTDRGDLDMTRVGMWGDGSGASIAIMAAAVDPRIKVLDLLDPWGDWPNWLAKSTIIADGERSQYLKPEFLKKVENLDPVKWLPELRTQLVRLQYINSVKVTPDVAKQRIEAAAPANVKLAHYQDAREFLRTAAAGGKGFEWIKQQLESGVAVQGSNNVAEEKSAGKKNEER